MRELVRELRARGHLAELVSVPFKWYPKEEILPHAAAWRLLDLSESNGRPVDVVIASKFPTYFVRHPRKVAWLVHQYRAAYELCGTAYSDFTHTEQDVGLRDRIMALDTEMLGECRAALRHRPHHRGATREVQRPARHDALSSAASGAAADRGTLRRLHPVGGSHRSRQARRSRRPRDGACRSCPPAHRRRRWHAARECRAGGAHRRRGRPRHVPRPCRR